LLAARNEYGILKDRVMMPSTSTGVASGEETSFGVLY